MQAIAIATRAAGYADPHPDPVLIIAAAAFILVCLVAALGGTGKADR